MGQLATLKKMVGALQRLNCRFCLVGGHAASLYRSQARVTRDVDFAIAALSTTDSRQVAEEALKAAGYRAAQGFIPGLPAGQSTQTACMVTSIPPKNELHGDVDILLPEMPWVNSAVKRAQDNLIDLGFAKVPVITPEDLIIAKCYALKFSPDRFQDMDDVKEILLSKIEIDFSYISAKFAEYSVTLPAQLRKYAPKVLKSKNTIIRTDHKR